MRTLVALAKNKDGSYSSVVVTDVVEAITNIPTNSFNPAILSTVGANIDKPYYSMRGIELIGLYVVEEKLTP